MFTKGHTLSKGKRKPGGGKKKSPSTIIKLAMENDAYNLPQYFVKLSQLALNGDREALFYFIDRHLGKPKASTEIDLKGGLQLTAGQQAELFVMLARMRKELDNPDIKLIGEGNAKGTSED